jgi:hypothetical protein
MSWVLFCAEPLGADEDYVHSFTGFTFPPKVTAFARQKITPYNEAKSDIGVDYDNNPFTVHLSIYVYPAQDPLKKHFEQCKDDVLQVHPDAKLLEEKPFTLTKAGVPYDGFSALYAFRGKFIGDTEQELLSKLLCFRRGDYYVTFRISYAKSDQKAAESQIADFLDKFTWPSGNATETAATI